MTGIPTMFDGDVRFAGIRLRVDPIDRPRSEGSDNVMAIFYEEQPFAWEFVHPYVAAALRHSPGSLGFLDVGTGSGVFGILAARHFPGTVVRAIDKSARAIEQARANAALNRVSLDLCHEEYAVASAPSRSARVIGLNPPFHLYPGEVADKIPQHARGGTDGQGEFRSQLRVAEGHLAEGGIIFFIMMCLGDGGGPTFCSYVPELVPGGSLEYCSVLPRIATAEFLEGVYGSEYVKYRAETVAASPWLYYCVGIIRRDGLGEIREVPHHIDLHGRSWDDRIALHREIARHAW